MGGERRVRVIEIGVGRVVEGEGGGSCGRVDRSEWSRICSSTCTWGAECVGRGDVGLLDQGGMKVEIWGGWVGVCWE